jgi:anaerobic ribonucleoside-triphosphate reductase activating protein
MSKPLKYTDTIIGFREVPDEVSLCINISNCVYKCLECHSPELQEDIGYELTPKSFVSILNTYKAKLGKDTDYITCITFLGDGGNIDDLGKIIQTAHNFGYLTCLYTGSTEVMNAVVASDYTLDFIKVGRYMKDMGPLDNPNTNQRFYKIHYLDTGWTLEDLTCKFQIKQAQ